MPADDAQAAARRHREEAARPHQHVADGAEAAGAGGLREARQRQAGESGDIAAHRRPSQNVTL